MGDAGIVRELLRFTRTSTGIDPTYAVPWPRPSRRRTAHSRARSDHPST